MNKSFKNTIFWTPRVLGILFILFISLFALDILEMKLSTWDTFVDMFVHLLPSMAMILALVLAWRWEWIGAAFFFVVGAWFLYISTPGDVMYYLVFNGVPFVIAVCFFLGWIYRKGSTVSGGKIPEN